MFGIGCSGIGVFGYCGIWVFGVLGLAVNRLLGSCFTFTPKHGTAIPSKVVR